MIEPRKTVVIISPAFPENESATYWVPSQQLLVKALKRNFPQYDFVVQALLYPYQKGEYTWHNIPVTSYNGARYPGAKRLLLWWKVWKKLKALRREKQLVGILSFWCMEAALVGSYFAKRYQLPHFCWICGQDARSSNRYVKLIRPRANELVAISDFVAKEFERNFHIKPKYVIPNAIDASRFESNFPAHRDIDILGVGALIPLKKFDIFINVIDQVRKHIPSVRAKICGIGEDKEKLVAMIEKLGLQQHIELTGALKHEEVLQLMQRTKLLIHPSAYEGFSTVCLEALYAGAHVTSFVKPMEHHMKNWHIVSTPQEMVDTALGLLQSSLQHERIVTYSIDDIAGRMMQLFEQRL